MPITLSGGVDTWFVDQFSKTLHHVCQQKESKFGQAVRVEPVLNAEDKSFDMMDEFSLEEKTGRNPDTPSLDATTQRRWVTTTPYHNSVLKDKDDDLQMIVEPTSDFVTAFRRAVNRKKDDIILAAMDATVYSGRRRGSTITWASQYGTTAYTSAAGGSDTGGRTIIYNCAQGNCSAADVGMTVEKIELVKEYFALNNVDEDSPIWGAINPIQATDLFGQEEYVNRDYGGDDALATGRIRRNFHGVNWIISNKVVVGSSNDTTSGQNVYRCPFWIQDGIVLGVQDEVSLEMSIRDDKSYAQQIYVHMNMGAMRMDEDLVCFVETQ